MRDHEIDRYSTVVPRFASPSFPHLWHRPDAVQSHTLIILDILVMCVGLEYTGTTRTTPVSSVFLRCVSRVSSCFSVGEILSVRSGDLRSNGAEMQALSALSRRTGSVVDVVAVFPAAGVVGQHVWHFFPGINSFVDRSRHVNWIELITVQEGWPIGKITRHRLARAFDFTRSRATATANSPPLARGSGFFMDPRWMKRRSWSLCGTAMQCHTRQAPFRALCIKT